MKNKPKKSKGYKLPMVMVVTGAKKPMGKKLSKPMKKGGC